MRRKRKRKRKRTTTKKNSILFACISIGYALTPDLRRNVSYSFPNMNRIVCGVGGNLFRVFCLFVCLFLMLLFVCLFVCLIVCFVFNFETLWVNLKDRSLP